jgi:glutamine amidotransferase
MTSRLITVINAGMGNLGSVTNALEILGASYAVSARGEDLDEADAIILPGVGGFPAAMKNLRSLGLPDALRTQVVTERKPFLGICLGMQLLARDSVELGQSTGLGWIDAHVARLDPAGHLRIPHVGWNTVSPVRGHPLFHGIESSAHFYFDHSYHVVCPDDLISATCRYGGTLVAALQRDNILATQFHPEKSQRNGLKVLRNFLNFVRDWG